MTQQMGRPYIYYAFYLRTPPALFRKSLEVSRDRFGFVTVEKYDKYIFPNTLNSISGDKTLFIAKPKEVPLGAKILKRFFLPNGSEQLDAYVTSWR